MSTADRSLPLAGTAVLVRAADDGFEVLVMRRPERGSFAGAWVFPGGKVEQGDRHPGDGEVEQARRAAVRETFEEVGLHVDDLAVFSEWQPPLEAPTRIRTWFFLAEAPDAEVSPSADEVAEVAWVRPQEALARHGAGEWTLYPPTWVTLHQLSAFTDAPSALSSGGAVQLFQTRVLGSETGQVFAWEQGRLEAGTLPWRFIAG
ncbi:NUDIX domain-containing protein [Microbacterium sp. NPDC028030]|uniref:NUDIX hydrolase n=1 Tax=Microbacterium sp. NPDC028030 TaxID=3155124 RepID=UPI00340A326A